MSQVKLVQGDALPNTPFSLTDADSGLPIDLTEAAFITLYFRPLGSTATPQSVPCAIEDAAEGLISITWGATTLDTAGLYEGEFSITHANGKTYTVFKKQLFNVREQIG